MTHALHAAFLESVALYGMRPALESSAGPLSYLDVAAACAERSALISGQARHVVALCMSRSAEAALWQLACSKAGQPFAPLDPEWPEERLAECLSRLAARWVVSGAEMDLSRLGLSLAKHCAGFRLWERQSAAVELDGSLGHVFFSSGSTGRPKAILLRGAPVIAVARAQALRLGIDSSSRCAWLLSPAFDASLSDIYSCWTSGACLTPFEGRSTRVKSLARFLRDARCTHADVPPSMLAAMDPQGLPELRCVVFGGELAKLAEIERWRRAGKRLFNAYGPTEATVCTHMAEALAGWEPNIVGEALDGVACKVFSDGAWREPEPGIRGELGIMGDHLALGYDDLALSETRFLNEPVGRLYRTGDLFFFGHDGTTRYVGRLDRQFKRAGALACPEEIEAAAISAGCVEARLSISGRRLILDYAGPVAAPELLAELARRLPSHLVPNEARRSESLPRGSTGKLA